MPRLGYKAPTGPSFGDLEIYGLDECTYAQKIAATALGEQDVINAEGADTNGQQSHGGYAKRATNDPIDSTADFIIRHEDQMGKSGSNSVTAGNHGKQG